LIFVGLTLVVEIVVWTTGKSSRPKLQHLQSKSFQLMPSAPPFQADEKNPSIWTKQSV
jgi:hypothetical protein